MRTRRAAERLGRPVQGEPLPEDTLEGPGDVRAQRSRGGVNEHHPAGRDTRHRDRHPDLLCARDVFPNGLIHRKRRQLAGLAGVIVPHRPRGDHRARGGRHRSVSMGACSSTPGTGAVSEQEWREVLLRFDFGQLIAPGGPDREVPVVVPTHFLYDGDAPARAAPGPAQPGLAGPGRAPGGAVHRDRRLRLRPGRGQRRPGLGPGARGADQLLRRRCRPPPTSRWSTTPTPRPTC